MRVPSAMSGISPLFVLVCCALIVNCFFTCATGAKTNIQGIRTPTPTVVKSVTDYANESGNVNSWNIHSTHTVDTVSPVGSSVIPNIPYNQIFSRPIRHKSERRNHNHVHHHTKRSHKIRHDRKRKHERKYDSIPNYAKTSELKERINAKIQEYYPEAPHIRKSKFFRRQNKAKKACANCASSPASIKEEAVKKLRIQMFIKTFAEKLRMTPDELMANSSRKPFLKIPSQILDKTFEESQQDQDNDGFYAKDEMIITPGRRLGKNCISRRTSGCYEFDLNGKLNGIIASAQLWLYKRPDANDDKGQTLIVHTLTYDKWGKVQLGSIRQYHETNVRKGWVKITIDNTTTSLWLKDGTSNKMFAVQCITCASRKHRSLFQSKPLLMIKDDSIQRYRGKRDTERECNPAVECCKRHLEVDFANIGMPNIIPPKLITNYCYGECAAITQHTYKHTKVKQHVINSMQDVDEDLRFSLKPCCVPVSLKGAVALIQSAREFIPNIIVERCGCK